MTGQIAARIRLALTGALGGAALWAAIQAADRNWLGDFSALALFVFLTTAFGAVLALAGPIGLGRAVPRGLALGVLVGALT